MYILDTNVISEMIKKQPDSNVMQKIKLHQDEIATTAPVWHELNFGYEKLPCSKKKDIIKINHHYGQPIAKKKIAELGDVDKSKMGMVIGGVMKELDGKADGDDVKAVVEELMQ